uniref:Uncharacterized protein n=1 Tax=Arundo donax TaxID=35708 RepID=A0A0A9BDU1_ARUDO
MLLTVGTYEHLDFGLLLMLLHIIAGA